MPMHYSTAYEVIWFLATFIFIFALPGACWLAYLGLQQLCLMFETRERRKEWERLQANLRRATP